MPGPEPPTGPPAGHKACPSVVMLCGDLAALGRWPGWTVGLAEDLAAAAVEDGWAKPGEQVARCPHGSIFGAPEAEGPGSNRPAAGHAAACGGPRPNRRARRAARRRGGGR